MDLGDNTEEEEEGEVVEVAEIIENIQYVNANKRGLKNKDTIASKRFKKITDNNNMWLYLLNNFEN